MTITTLFPTRMVVIYIPEWETNKSIKDCVIPLLALSISILNLLEAKKAISIPEKKADNKRQINTTNIVVVILFAVVFQPLPDLLSV